MKKKKKCGQKHKLEEAIIERSGTKFNSGVNPELAMSDAETRLQSGGGLFGNDGLRCRWNF